MMRFVFVSFALHLVLVSFVTGSLGADPCTFTLPDGAQFNFQPLSITPKSTFQGQNKADHAWSASWQCSNPTNCAESPSYEYRFNLCAPLQKSPEVPSPSGSGSITGCDGADVSAGDGWNAYQFYKNTTNPLKNQCHTMAKAEPAPEPKLIKQGNPSQGFMLQYVGGANCTKDDNTKVGRTFTIHVRCSANLPAEPKLDSNQGAGQFKTLAYNRRFSTFADGPTSAPSADDCFIRDLDADCRTNVGNVYEAEKCQYHVNIDTVLGCPQSCRIGDTACSNRGICAEDTSSKRTRCFCDVGFGGEYCENVVDTSAVVTRSPNTVLTVFVLILLFAALGLGYALYRKIRGFHGDYDHQYGQLAAKPDQAGNLQHV